METCGNAALGKEIPLLRKNIPDSDACPAAAVGARGMRGF
jgi:hypothetical protein